MPPRERRSYKYTGIGGPYRRQFVGDPMDLEFHPVTRLGGCSLHWKAAWEATADGANLGSMTDRAAGTWTLAGDIVMDLDACNGRPAVVFDTNDYAYHSTNHSVPISVIALAKAGSTKARVISTHGGDNWLLGWWGATMNEFYFDGWVLNSTTACDTNWHLAYADITGGATNSNVYWDTVLTASNTTGVGDPNQIRLNGSGISGGSEYSDCTVAEIIAFNRILSAGEREMLFEYFNSYYRLNL